MIILRFVSSAHVGRSEAPRKWLSKKWWVAKSKWYLSMLSKPKINYFLYIKLLFKGQSVGIFRSTSSQPKFHSIGFQRSFELVQTNNYFHKTLRTRGREHSQPGFEFKNTLVKDFRTTTLLPVCPLFCGIIFTLSYWPGWCGNTKYNLSSSQGLLQEIVISFAQAS